MKNFDATQTFLKEKMKMPIDKMLDAIEWQRAEKPESNSGLPFVTHEGRLQIGSFSLTVYQLSNGQRIFPESELEKIFSLENAPEK